MSGSTGEGSAPAAEGAWLVVSDALLRGVGHAMNNRAAALSAVVQVLASSGPQGPLEGALRSETERLQRVVELLRLLPRRWESDPEPVLVGDLVPSALELLALHSDLPETRFAWEADGSLPPVLVEPSLLIHVLCLLGTAAAKEAARTGARAVSFRGSSDGDAVRVEIVVGEPDPSLADPAAPEGGEDPAAAEALLAHAGGELSVERDGELRMAFRLPTLAAARRRER
jgi:hypothetical protein